MDLIHLFRSGPVVSPFQHQDLNRIEGIGDGERVKAWGKAGVGAGMPERPFPNTSAFQWASQGVLLKSRPEKTVSGSSPFCLGGAYFSGQSIKQLQIQWNESEFTLSKTARYTVVLLWDLVRVQPAPAEANRSRPLGEKIWKP